MTDSETNTAVEEPSANGAEPAVEDTANTAATDVVAVIAERDDYLDQLQRSRAEFANFRRRTDQERFQIRELVNRDLLGQILPVVDDFDRALAAIPETERATSWVQGIDLIANKLRGILERAGVASFEALGLPFDPAWHEAVATEPGSAGTVVTEVYQTGYRLGQSLLRPAMVKVGDPEELSAVSRQPSAVS